MLSVQGSEKSLFMAALLLAFKIVEDWGCVDMASTSLLLQKKKWDAYTFIFFLLEILVSDLNDPYH